MDYINFPHQINDIKKLRNALVQAHDIICSGKELTDHNFGYNLFRKKIIQSRNGYTEEKLKTMPENRQSPIMTARELKRTFLLMGFLEKKDGPNEYVLTSRGQQVIGLGIDDNIDYETLIWRESLLNLKFYSVSDSKHTNEEFRSRPIYVMMNLLSRPLKKQFLVFGMTAKDESEKTIARLKETVKKCSYDKYVFEEEIKQIGMTLSNARNNVKILPAFGINTGLFYNKNGLIGLTNDGIAILDQEKNKIPIWYVDLDKGDEKKRQCKAGILLALINSNIKKSILDNIVASFGLDPSIITQFDNGLVKLDDSGSYSLTSQISFDLYQDLPADVRNSKEFEQFRRLIEYCTTSQKTKPDESPVLQTYNYPQRIYKRNYAKPRKIDSVDQLTKTYTPPTINPDEYLRCKEIQQEKDSMHQEVVKKLYKKYVAAGCNDITEWPYDLLVRKNNIHILHEVKTITKQNEPAQVRTALGQIYYYKYFSLKDCKSNLLEAIVFDQPPNDTANVEFLRSHDILVFWFDKDAFSGEERSLEKLDNVLAELGD